MPITFTLAGAVIMLLTIVEAALPQSRSVLPIGGHPMIQIAIVLGLAYVIVEFCAVYSKFFGKHDKK